MGCSTGINVVKDKTNNTQYILQKILIDHSESISHESIKYILVQMENCICKIKCKDGFGTGFFCVIPFPDFDNLLPVLITNNHVLEKKDIEIGKEIIFTTNNEKNFNKIYIGLRRKVYTNEKPFDITIIEIIKEDISVLRNIFLEIDDHLLNSNITSYDDIYSQKSIYLLHYPNGEKMEYSTGVIKKISLDNCDMQHTCATEKGSSGSPMINLSNYKVVGIHKGSMDIKNWNLGTLLKGPIDDFNKLYKNINKIDIPLKIFNPSNVEYTNFDDGINNIDIGRERKVNFKDIVAINFVSSDQTIRYPMKCLKKDTFSRVEEKLYNIYPKLKEHDNFFLYNGRKILRFKTIEENNIRDGSIISMFAGNDFN